MTFEAEWQGIRNKWTFPSAILNSKQSMDFLKVTARYFFNKDASQQAVEADAQKPCPVCELMMRPDHNFNFCMMCGANYYRTA